MNSRASLQEVLTDSYPWCVDWLDELGRLFAAYTAEKQRQQVLDYDDLQLYWAGMMAEPALAGHVGSRFDHILVDEYQDTNRIQAAILQALKPDGRGVTVVGDDAQSIYSFRAAEVRNILDFPQQFAVPARVVTLVRNYRSTQPILAASNAVIAEAAERFTKDSTVPLAPACPGRYRSRTAKGGCGAGITSKPASTPRDQQPRTAPSELEQGWASREPGVARLDGGFDVDAVARAPPPDAPYWPGRRWLAAIDAIAWPAVACRALHELTDFGGLALPLVMALLVVSVARRLFTALLATHRYHFTTWRWGRVLTWMLAVGLLLKLGLVA